MRRASRVCPPGRRPAFGRTSALLSPIALLTSACATRPWTPAVSVAYWSQAPEAHETVLPAQADALRRWQLPPGDPWAGYAKYTLLTSLDAQSRQVELPDVATLPEVQRASAAGQRIGAGGLPRDTLWVVDMRGPASVAFGAALSQAAREPVTLVPTFNNWPAEDELVPAEETLAALAAYAPRSGEGIPGARPVFLLDSWRLAYRFDEPGEDTYDNRYILSSSDLPDVDTLRAQGIRRVVYVVLSLDDTAVEEDDLHAAFLAWERAGIPIAMVDLARFEQPMTVAEWDGVWIDDPLVVEPRLTLIEQPGFYARARGGFGGVRARPSPLYGGGGWTFHGGYSGAGGHGHGGGG
jgi:hypothetical protein